MVHRIDKHHAAIRSGRYTDIGLLVTSVKLFFLYVAFGLHRAAHLLFSPAQKSYELVHGQPHEEATLSKLEAHHLFKRQARFASVASPLVLVVSAVVVMGITQAAFPADEVPYAQAAAVTCTVTSSADTGAGTLRDCIEAVNNQSDDDSITVNINLGSDETLTLGSSLPRVDKPFTLQSLSEIPRLTVDGAALASSAACLELGSGASGSAISGIILANCKTNLQLTAATNVTIGRSADENADRIYLYGGEDGIFLDEFSANNTITNVWVGVQSASAVAGSLSGTGVSVLGNSNTLSELLVGNANIGVYISGDNNTLDSSRIGIDFSDNPQSNTQDGVQIVGSNNTIGSTSVSAGNLIANNGDNGIEIFQIDGVGGDQNKIEINTIGSTSAGLLAANNGHGISLLSADNTSIGDQAAAVGPTISGNAKNGVNIVNSDSVLITNALIGSSENGEPVANSTQAHGIYASNSTNVSIKESAIGLNKNSGIYLSSGTEANITANLIGKNSIGSAHPNGSNGITLDGAGSVTIGSEGSDNIIVNNGGAGVYISEPVSESTTTVQYNSIGQDGAGNTTTGVGVAKTVKDTTVLIQNNLIMYQQSSDTSHGVSVDQSSGVLSITDNTIQENTGFGIDLISGDGVQVKSNNISGNRYGMRLSASTGAVIESNVIGLDKDGTAKGNEAHGISIEEASYSNVIGSTDPSLRNVISSNGAYGINLSSEAGDSNIVINNYIGLGNDGKTERGNSGPGVEVAADNQNINGNVIAGNGQEGIYVLGDSATVTDNIVGWDSTVSQSVLNGASGILVVADGATVSDNTITSGGQGIYLSKSDHTISDNNIASSGENGILIANAKDTAVTGNTVKLSEKNGIKVEGGSGLVFTGNTLKKNTKAGIVFAAGATDSRVGPKIGSASKTAKYNTLSNNGGAGIRVKGSATKRIKITQNIYSGNAMGATSISESANTGLTAPTVTAVSKKQVSGTGAVKGGSVQVYNGGTYIGQKTNTSAGSWVVTLQQALNTSASTIRAQIIDSRGNTSPFSGDSAVGDTDGDTTTVVTDGEDFALDTVASAGKTTATLEVRTSASTTVVVKYGTSSYNLANQESSTTPGTYHKIELSGLTGEKTYYYKVIATSTSGDVEKLTGQLSTAAINAEYLTQNTKVNGQPVFDPTETIYVDPKKRVNLSVGGVPEKHEVKLRLKKSNGTVVKKTKYKSGKNGKASGSFKVKKNKTYDAQAKAREASNTKKSTDFVNIAKIAPTAKAPIITSLTGDYTITGDSSGLVFSGDSSGRTGHFRIVNASTGVLVAEGNTDKDGIYKLPFDLAVGRYVVYFEGKMKGGKYTAAASHDLIVVNPRSLSSVLTTDQRSADYFNRLVGATFTLVGVSDRAGIIYIDGKKAGEISVADGVSWSTKLDLNALGIGVGDHQLEIQFLNQAGDPWGDIVNYPFKRVKLVDPVITQSSSTVVRNGKLTVSVLGGNGYRINVYEDDTLIDSQSIVSSDGGPIGGVELSPPTGKLGTFTWTIEAENSFGTRTTSQEVTWKVVAPTPVKATPAVVPSAEEGDGTETADESVTDETGEEEVDETTGEDSPTTETDEGGEAGGSEDSPTTETDEVADEVADTADETTGNGNDTADESPERSIPGAIVDEDGLIILPDDSDLTEEEVAELELIVVPEDLVDGLNDEQIDRIGKINEVLAKLPKRLKPKRKSDPVSTPDIRFIEVPADEELDLPAEYLEVATDLEEIEVIKSTLDEKNVDTLNIDLTETAVDPETGAATGTNVVQPNAAGVRVMRKTVEIGFPSLATLLGREEKDSGGEQYVKLTGATAKYGKVKLAIFSDPIVKVTRADDTGQWVMNVDVNELPVGEHTAFLQSESRGVASDELEIARFVVIEEERISNTTWIFIVNLAVAMVLLVVVISMQVRKHGNGGGRPPSGGKGYTSDSSIGGLESHTLPLKDEGSGNDPPPASGALGI